MLYEDFGLTTCEAIAGGCIPVVVNSGGQKEIVTLDDLRFNSVEEATRIIKRIDAMPRSELEGLRKKLFDYVKQFDEANFKRNMLNAIFRRKTECQE
jgi:glycosyltransferase involved in cell wall biosynthesis